MIPLRQIAHARSGDKGFSANVAIFGRTPADYAWLRDHLTAEMVEAWFKPLGVGKVVRYDAPNLEALNFVLPNVLAGGGSRSLRIDAQGKALGQALLEMEVDVARTSAPDAPRHHEDGPVFSNAHGRDARATLKPCPPPH